MTRVFVAGAGGAIVRRLVPQLVARGHHVVASTTRTEKIADLRTFGAEALVMDGLDPASVGDAVARMMPDVVVHQMSALAGTDDLKQFDDTFATTNDLRTKGDRPPARRCGSGRRAAVCCPELHGVARTPARAAPLRPRRIRSIRTLRRTRGGHWRVFAASRWQC
jgi:hypothetical protein